MRTKHISIIVPIYGDDQMIFSLNKKILASIKKLTNNYEIIYVNDKNDLFQTHLKLKIIKNNNKKIIIINNLKNLGQSESIKKAFKLSKGKYVGIIDCDLQEDPKYFAKFYYSIKNYDAVRGIRQIEPSFNNYFKKMINYIFFWLLIVFKNVRHSPFIGHFGLYKRQLLKSFYRSKYQNKLLPIYIKKISKNVTDKNFEYQYHNKKSSYNIFRLIKVALRQLV